MKTNAVRSSFLLRAAVAFAASAVIPSAIAGAGADGRRTQGEPSGSTAVAPVKPTSDAVLTCTDARLVPITERRFTNANGRGPTRTVEVGKKLICTSCDTPMIVMKPSGLNARGAMAPVAIKGTHDCTKSDCKPSAITATIN